MAPLTKNSLPQGSLRRDKADNTTSVARAIADAETSARNAKTAKLRMLRLEKEAADEAARAAAEPPVRPARPRKVVKKGT